MAGRPGYTSLPTYSQMSEAILIVDGDNLAHRAYHSTPKSRDGEPINAIIGFFSILLRLYEAERPGRVFVAWDTLGVDTYRNELWPAYQGGREFDADILVQLDRLPDLCRSFAFGVGKASGFEADDLMASARAVFDGEALLYTTDRDAYQLVDERTTVLSPRRGGGAPERIGVPQVVERLGVLPAQVVDFKALCGDPSDRIPGIKGIGPKSAASLLLAHGTLDRVVEAWSRPSEDTERARLFRKVVTMRLDAPVVLPESAPDWVGGAEALRAVGAAGLAARLERASLDLHIY